MRKLYPELASHTKYSLQLEGDHVLYFEQSGNPDGVPVVFLHGGPGSGCKPDHRRYFNADLYRIIILDQRGCKRSTPNGCIQHNSTQLLLADLEAIRQQLNIEQWVLFGGSWGATLALLYAEQYPQHVCGMILRGTFLARQRDIDWFLDVRGVRQIFPDYWQEFVSVLSDVERHDLVASFYDKVVVAEDEAGRLLAAKAWALWAGRVVTHSLAMTQPYAVGDEHGNLLNEVRIEVHYAKHHYFIEDDQIINNISQLPNVPLTIIHGRQDLTCLPESAWRLHQLIAGSQLVMVDNAGHLAAEPAMVDALISATDGMLRALA